MNDLRTLPAQWCGAWAVGWWGLLTPQENAVPRKPTRSRRAAYFLGVVFRDDFAGEDVSGHGVCDACGRIVRIRCVRHRGESDPRRAGSGSWVGVALIVWGGSQVIKNWVITILAIIAGTIIIRADTLVTSLGATI